MTNQISQHKFLLTLSRHHFRKRIVAFLQISVLCTQWNRASTFVVNRTAEPKTLYLVPVSSSDVETFRQGRQQQTVQQPSQQAPQQGVIPALQVPIQNTATNVVQILSGLFGSDVRPIISGSTAFIPGEDLREGVEVILQNLAPGLQNFLFGNGNGNGNRGFQTEKATVPPPRSVAEQQPQNSTTTIIIRIVDETGKNITNNPVDLTESVDIHNPAAATKILTTTEEVITTTTTELPSTSRPSTTTQRLTTRATTPKSVTEATQQFVLNFRKPNEGSSFPSSLYFPESPQQSSKFNIPQSAYFGPNNLIKGDQSLSKGVYEEVPAAALPTTNVETIIRHPIAVGANFVEKVEPEFPTTTEKKYLYLVLLPDEYEEYVKSNNGRNPAQPLITMVASPPLPPPVAAPQPMIPTYAVVTEPLRQRVTTESTDNLVIAASETTVQSNTEDPDPRNPGTTEDEDDDDDDNLVNRVITSITS